MASKILIALAVVAAVLALTEAAAVPQPFQYALQDEQNCKCMNWRNCLTGVNSDINCGQSYIMVCCLNDPIDPVAESQAKIIPMELDN